MEANDYVMDNYQEHVAEVEILDPDGAVRVGRYNTIHRGPVVTLGVKEDDNHTHTWLSIDEARQLALALVEAAASAERQLDRWAAYKESARFARFPLTDG